jgi:hypothetical protein
VLAKRECGDYNSREAEDDDKGSQQLHLVALSQKGFI